MLGLLAGLALLGGPARAETLGEVLAAHGMPSPPPRLGRVDQPLETYQVLDDERDLVVVYVAKPPGGRLLQIVRFERATGRWTAAVPRRRRTTPPGPTPSPPRRAGPASRSSGSPAGSWSARTSTRRPSAPWCWPGAVGGGRPPRVADGRARGRPDRLPAEPGTLRVVSPAGPGAPRQPGPDEVALYPPGRGARSDAPTWIACARCTPPTGAAPTTVPVIPSGSTSA